MTQTNENKPNLKRVLIVGISSYLGSALALGLKDSYEVFGTFYKTPFQMDGVTTLPLNVTEGGEITDILQILYPDIIIYCSGIRDAKTAETNPAVADAVNSKAPSIFFKLLRSRMHFLYFAEDRFQDARSTDPEFVIEETATSIVSYQSTALAKTKITGENVVRANKHNTHIFRLGHLYGENLGSVFHPRYNWLGTILRTLQRSESCPTLSNTQRSFVYIGDVVRAIRLFLTNIPLQSTTWHLSHDKNIESHFNVAEYLCEHFDLDSQLLIPQKHSMAAVPDWGPERLVMRSKNFTEAFNFEFQSAHDGVFEMSERYRLGFFNSWT